MAKSRMAAKELSDSVKFAALGKEVQGTVVDYSACTLWYLLFPHMDALGRFYGDALKVKAICCPYFKWSEEDVERMLKELENTKRDVDGLGWVVRYKAHNGQHCMWLPGFRDANPNLDINKEAVGKYDYRSNIPAPPEAVLDKWRPDKPPPVPLPPKEKLTVTRTLPPQPDIPANIKEYQDFYETTFGTQLTASQLDDLKHLDRPDLSIFMDAVMATLTKKPGNPWPYLLSILKDKEVENDDEGTKTGNTSEGLVPL